jgi:hypothetical protein
MAEEPDDVLSPAEIATEIEAAGIPLTAGNLQAMIAAARTQDRTEARSIDLFPLKPILPLHVSYEVGRRACADGDLRAVKIAGDWYARKEDVAAWLAEKPARWFESEAAVQEWRAYIAGLQPRWIP